MTTTDLPPRSEVTASPFLQRDGLLPGADFGDSYSLVIADQKLSVIDVSTRVFGQTPGWVKRMLAVRTALVAPFGLITGTEPMPGSVRRIGMLPILEQSDDHVVLGLDDRHLDFRVLIEIKEQLSLRQEVCVSTAVKTHNAAGRAYLAFVKPFHRIVVPAMLRQLVSAKPRRLLQ
ncbi:hypothetical protein FF80_00879 [Devosia sp. LC5]|uniref:DUF2867 domain-containing protein n=1 Tax=Devosia sp. LC5 TaxID=1502724 RepID=UPI0004E35BF6|nr:DUF2867 domain-containing protein [Devosia sp. LC5]KFC70607.1 hypothetical protein FF80_00879 [Devosia sp. LC5]